MEAPHVVLRHEPKVCSAGRADLGDTVEVGPVRRQVFEIPPMKAEATEEMVTRRCGCGRATTADAPVGVDAPVQYGPWLAQGSVAAMTQRTGFAWRATS